MGDYADVELYEIAYVEGLEAALQQIADLHAQSMGRPDDLYMLIAKTMGEMARVALKRMGRK